MYDLRSVSEEGPPQEIRQHLFSEERYSEQAVGTPINDVVENVGQMAMEFAAARRWDGEIPCLKLDDGAIAPISLTEFFGPLWFEWMDRLPFPPYRIWREGFRRSWLQQEERIVVTDVRHAEEGIQRSLNGFFYIDLQG